MAATLHCTKDGVLELSYTSMREFTVLMLRVTLAIRIHIYFLNKMSIFKSSNCIKVETILIGQN